MSFSFNLEPKFVKEVNNPFRRIIPPFPAPESLPVLKELKQFEPRSMDCQPPVLWHKASGFQVFDRFGNIWLDWSSGVLVANAGHGRDEIKAAIKSVIDQGLLHNYCFPSELRAKLVKKLVEIAPPELSKVFLLTTGAEAVECAIKIARAYAHKIGGKEKNVIISFEGAFHGRTLGAQTVGGIPELKEWIVNIDPEVIIVPYPGDWRCKNKSFDVFLRVLKEKNISGKKVAAVISETFQGRNAGFMPQEYFDSLYNWCKENQVLLILDEIQAAFGRTGKMFGFEHYKKVPDIITLGKGITSSLPLSAVVSRKEIMDVFEPGTMTSTHTGNPLCVAAAIANIDLIQKESLLLQAEEKGEILKDGLEEIWQKFRPYIGYIQGKGLVWAVHVVKNNTEEPNGFLAFKVVEKCVEKGLLLFAPVGKGEATIKICPPLIITENALQDGLSAFEEALNEAIQDVYSGIP